MFALVNPKPVSPILFSEILELVGNKESEEMNIFGLKTSPKKLAKINKLGH